MKRKFHTCMIVGTTILLLVSLASLCMGQFSVSVPDVFRILFRQSTISHNAEIVVWNVRIPRILLSLICGAGLSVAGASFQALFSNAGYTWLCQRCFLWRCTWNPSWVQCLWGTGECAYGRYSGCTSGFRTDGEKRLSEFADDGNPRWNGHILSVFCPCISCQICCRSK